jgi:hypothetical protein
VEAQWARRGENDLGYLFWLMNKADGKVYFKCDKVGDDNVFPRYFDAIWSVDSKYVAINQYFGRAMAEISIFYVGGKKPQLCNDLPAIDPMEMIRPLDKQFYPGWNHNKLRAEEWLNNTDLSVLQVVRFLKKDANDGTIDWDYHYVLRFKDGRATIIKQDKLPVDYK